LRIFEVDQKDPQAWKKQRLLDLGFGIPDWLRFVPLDFEAGEAWWDALLKNGFDPSRPSIFASAGLSMYLSKEASRGTLEKIARLAPGTCLAMTFILPIEATDPELRPGLERAVAGAKASGTPFISFFMPEEIVDLARQAGFKDVQHISALDLTRLYFGGRSDGLQPPRNSEEFILARL
jgi:methyltransferase (TIGR00027 family)